MGRSSVSGQCPQVQLTELMEVVLKSVAKHPKRPTGSGFEWEGRGQSPE